MESEGHERNAKNYKLAVNHLERYIGTTKIMFSILTTSVLTQWIDTLYKTSRAKEMIRAPWQTWMIQSVAKASAKQVLTDQ